MQDVFNQGDAVRYVGTKLHDVKKDKVGEIVATVEGENNEAYVVSFGGDDYIVHVASLARHTFKDKEPTGPIVEERIARKWAVEEV